MAEPHPVAGPGAWTRPSSRRSSRPTTVRGLVPEQIDEPLAHATGRAHVQVDGRRHGRRRPRHEAQLTGAGRRVRGRRVRGGCGRDHDRARLHRPALLRLRPPRPPRRDVHRQPQPGAVQRHQDVPSTRRTARHGVGSGRDPRARCSARVRSSAPVGDIHRGLPVPRRVRRPPALAGPAHRDAEDQGRRGRRQRDGRAHRARDLRPAAGRPGRAVTDVLRSLGTAPPPTTRPTRSSRPTSATSRSASWPRAPTSGWPSTATPTGASSSTSRAWRSRRRPSPGPIASREWTRSRAPR